MRFYFILISFFSVLSCNAQGSEFEKELSAFKFSLHPVLKEYDSRKLLENKYDKNDLIISKIDSFVRVNKQEILEYQLQLLAQYEDNANWLDKLEQYTAADANIFNQQLKEKNVNELFPLSKLLWINPLKEVAMYRNMYLMSKQSQAEYADFNARLTIGSSLISTEKIDEYKWKIVESVYDHILIATYDLKNKRVDHVKIFTRKSETNHK